MARPIKWVAAPPVTPAPYGLLSAAVVLDDLVGDAGFGVGYQHPGCGAAYDAGGVCEPAPDFGTLSASVDDTGAVTLDTTGTLPDDGYTIDWGDGSSVEGGLGPSGVGTAGRTLDPGTYTILVTGDESGYVATVTVTVEDASASGPFTGEVAFSKVTTDGMDEVYEDPFALYNIFRCNPVGMSEADFQAAARDAFTLGEGRAVERMTAHQLARTSGAVDLTPTPGTGVHPVQALAMLELFAGSNYGGVPVVHSPVDVTSVLDHYGVAHRSGNNARLETLNGALLASGGGYDRLQGPPTDLEDVEGTVQDSGTGEAWLYVTGQTVVRRGPRVEVGPVMSRTPAMNVRSALTERLYEVTTECIVAAVLVDLYGGL